MHCEKNLCKNVIKITFEEKDTEAIRKGMEEVGIWLQFWLQQVANGSYI